MIGTHEFGDAIWMWFVPACVPVADVCGWLPTRAAMADECLWYPRVWRWQLEVVGVHVCVAGAIGCGSGPRVWR